MNTSEYGAKRTKLVNEQIWYNNKMLQAAVHGRMMYWQRMRDEVERDIFALDAEYEEGLS